MFKLTKPIFKIIIIFLFTILLCFIFAYLLYSVFAVSYFRYEIETPIKLLDGRIQKELADQPKMKRTDIYLNSKDDISKIMKYLGYPDKNIYPRPNQNPSYNPSTSDAGQFCLSSIFKDPPNDLLGVYLKKRDNNPLGTTYQNYDNKYTLDDLLKYEFAIEEAFVFWDINKKTPANDSIIKTKKSVPFTHILNDLGKKDFINDWLLNKEPDITEKPKEIKLGCYNSTPDSRLVKQLPSVTLTKLHKMGAVYFDGGIRLLPTNQQIDSLEKFEEFLSKYVNGAKNIYIFTFINGIHPECEIIRLNKKN